jgi:hypothetical protein
MAVTFIDWIYTDDPTNGTKQGALIMFPRIVDRWNVASLIASDFEGYRLVIITDHANEFTDPTIDISGTKWKDHKLTLISYSDLDTIRECLKTTEIDIIIFDDAKMLATISPVIGFNVIKPKILVLSTWGDTFKQLDVVTSKLTGLKLLSLNFINDKSDITWKVSRVPLSNRQLKYYDKVRAIEVSDSKVAYPSTRMITLYAYPDIIMNDYLIMKNICEADQTKYSDMLNLPGSWLSEGYIYQLYNDGPKLSSVIDGVASHWPLKQVIVTRFNHRYGVDLIKSFIQLMIQNKQNPYELNQVFSVSCTDDYELAINTYRMFNASTSGVLITNIVPLLPLVGISIIHITDSYSFSTFKGVIDKCHKRHLSTNADLIIYSYIASHHREQSSDEALYQTFTTDVNNADLIYSGLVSASTPISFNYEMGLIIP